MKRTPAFPKLPTDLVSTLFQKAQEFYALAPWEHFGDSDYFGVVMPETNELHFVSLMGGAGECFGFATYRGVGGLDFLQRVLDGEGMEDPRAMQLEQDGLLLEFTNKKFLDDFDLELAKSVDYKPASPKAWILLREMLPGWLPWFPVVKDVQALISVMSASLELLELSQENPDCLYHKSGKRFPVFTWQERNAYWKLEFWTSKKIESHGLDDQPVVQAKPVDELLLAKVKKLPVDADAAWEAHDFYSPEPVLEKDRPFFPRVCAILDKKSGHCFNVALISPEKNVGMEIRDLALKKMSELGFVPATIVTTNTEHVFGLFTLKEILDVDLLLGDPERGAELEASYMQKMLGV